MIKRQVIVTAVWAISFYVLAKLYIRNSRSSHLRDQNMIDELEKAQLLFELYKERDMLDPRPGLDETNRKELKDLRRIQDVLEKEFKQGISRKFETLKPRI